MLRVNNFSGFGRIVPAVGGGGYTIIDSDAQAFITATSITDDTIKQAVDELVLDIKAISSGAVWSALQVIYPFVGGTSSTNAVNLKQPGTFNGTMNGTITHNANGVTGDGSTGYIATGYTPATHGTANSEHVSIYSRTNSDGVKMDISALTTGTLVGSGLFTKNSNSTSHRSQAGAMTTSVSDSLGYFSVNRTASTGYRFRQNATNNNITQTSAALTSAEMNVMCRNIQATRTQFSDRNLAWVAIGTGLTQTDDGDLRTAVETFQDFLSRGVV